MVSHGATFQRGRVAATGTLMLMKAEKSINFRSG